MILGIWQRIQSLFKSKVVAEKPQQEPEAAPADLNRLSQMQARSTLQGVQSLKGRAADPAKPTASGSFKRWSAAEQPESTAGSPELTTMAPRKITALPGSSLSDVPGISKRRSMQELLDIGSDHFTAE